jgi:predicted RNA-binding Zn-ribbon protein involved in translation (DUF1610 family)
MTDLTIFSCPACGADGPGHHCNGHDHDCAFEGGLDDDIEGYDENHAHDEQDTYSNSHGGFATAADALSFIFGGNATFTLTSGKTNQHFTFKIRRKVDVVNGKVTHFVRVLTGPGSDWTDYTYIGFIATDRSGLIAGRKGDAAATSFKALSWTLKSLGHDVLPTSLTIQHEGSCGSCGRALTHPESIARGIGPDCAKKLFA